MKRNFLSKCLNRKLKVSYCNGFTLLEVMVSLLIVALALTSLVKGTAGNVNNANELRAKIFAQWVAINKTNEWRAQKLFPSVGRTSGQQMMGKQEWYWVANVINTENKDIRRVEVSVFKEEEQKEKKDLAIIKLVSFLSKSI